MYTQTDRDHAKNRPSQVLFELRKTRLKRHLPTYLKLLDHDAVTAVCLLCDDSTFELM